MHLLHFPAKKCNLGLALLTIYGQYATEPFARKPLPRPNQIKTALNPLLRLGKYPTGFPILDHSSKSIKRIATLLILIFSSDC